MIIGKAVIENEKYSTFAKFLLREIPKVKDNPTIWNALLFATGIPKNTPGKDAVIRYRKGGVMGNQIADTQAKTAITIGMPPQIVPWYLPIQICGMFHTNTPAIIYINEHWIQKFTKDSWYEPAQKFIFGTVLHEIVHYLDYAKDDSFLDCKRDDEDRGFIFEELAYGSKVKSWQSPSD